MGFIQFLEGYYMMLITEAVSIAKIASKPDFLKTTTHHFTQ